MAIVSEAPLEGDSYEMVASSSFDGLYLLQPQATTNSLTVRKSLDWPLWSGHFPASSVRRKGSSGLVVENAGAGAVCV